MTLSKMAFTAAPVALVSLLAVGFSPVREAPRHAGPRVVVIHDMEGLAGEDDLKEFSFANAEQYKKGQLLLVADVNAVIQGLFDGGASAVDVVDAHGSGNPEPDIPQDLLDPRAHQILKDVPFEPDIDLLEGTKYDAVALVGMHAKTGSRGFASHTITIGMEILLNGKSVSESEWFGYSWGRIGVPVIFDAGDDRLQADIAPTMPWVRFVVTKHATSVSTVELRPVDEVHAEMKAKAKDALQHLSDMKVMKIGAPIRATLHAVPPASLVMLKDVPGLDYNDNSVTFVAADFPAAYKGLMGLVRVAASGYTSVMNETLRASGTAPQITSAYRDALFARWADFGSGRWTAPPPPAPQPGRKYHGSN